jgi:hypothetical protein
MVQLIGVAFVWHVVEALALTVVEDIPVVECATALLTVVGVSSGKVPCKLLGRVLSLLGITSC